MQRVRVEIAEPHRQIAARTRQLAALSATVELLHTLIRFLKLTAKLRESLGGPGADLAKAAKTLSEIGTLRAEADLAGVAVVDAELPFLARAAADVRAEAAASLQRGLESLSQSEVGAALQVLANLGELSAHTERTVAAYAKRAAAAAAEALDATKLGAAAAAAAAAGGAGAGGAAGAGGRPGAPTTGARAADALWARLDAGLDKVAACAAAVWHLQRVLAKKRDPVTHALFLDDVAPPGGSGGGQLAAALPFDRFWGALTRALAEHFGRAYSAGGFVRDTLLGGYPRLLGALEALFARLLKECDAKEKGVPPAVRKGEAGALCRAAEAFQNGYLARSLARLNDAAGAAFPPAGRDGAPGGGGGGAVAGAPAPSDVAKYVARVHDELVAAGAHAGLCAAVAGGVAKSLTLFAEKCEYACAAGPEARQVTGPASAAQARTLAAATALEAAHAALAPFLPALPPAAADALAPALARLHACAADALAPLFRAAAERAEAAVAGMHGEAWGGATPGGGNSAACAALVAVLGHFHAEFAGRLSPSLPRGGALSPPPSRALAAQLAARVLTLFVRHAALLRPLSESGKLRLAQDCAELELAVGALAPLEALGPTYRALRALRPLLFLDTAAVAGSPLVAELPPSAVLHHLLSRAPPEVASPHARAGLTLQQYATWLERASEADVWRGVKAVLDAHEAAAGGAGAEAHPACVALAAVGARVAAEQQQAS
jgi:hypothetical protein